jgi:hypothetical protein
MNLLVVREYLTDKVTIGSLYVNNVFECYTLEDKDRHLENGGVKLYGETAIPLGSYSVVLTTSARFKRVLPLLRGVQGFDGVRIHAGNTAADTHGCILVGTVKTNTTLVNSKFAMTKLFAKLQTAVQNGEQITLRIERK